MGGMTRRYLLHEVVWADLAMWVPRASRTKRKHETNIIIMAKIEEWKEGYQIE
jgi:hypothetical protein